MKSKVIEVLNEPESQEEVIVSFEELFENTSDTLSITGIAYPLSNNSFREYMDNVIKGLDLGQKNNVLSDYLNSQIRKALLTYHPELTFSTFLEQNNNQDGYYLLSLIFSK